MSYVYHTDNAVFDLPPGFVDRSLTILEWPTATGGRIALTMQREPRQGDRPLDEVVRDNLAKISRTLKGYKELSRTHFDPPSVARVAFEHRHELTRVVQYQLYVSTLDGLLIFGATGRAADRADCEALFDQVLQSLKLREK